MDRKEFIKSLGMSSASLMAFYCMGNLTSCISKSYDPTLANKNIGTIPKIDFTLDLNMYFPNLKVNGGYDYKDNIIIARTFTGDFVALSKICTHQGVTVNFVSGKNNFNCPNHDSNFTTTGSVINGPADLPLKAYKTTYDNVNNTLRVFEA